MILVVGGTGHLGHVVVPKLRADGHDVRVLARGAAGATDLRNLGADLFAADIRDADAVREAAEGASVIVSAAHGLVGTGDPTPATVDRDGNRNVVDAAAATGADVVLLSLVDAGPDHPSELHRMKAAAEVHLLASGVPWTIVRGTPFAETWRDQMLSAAKDGRVQVFGKGHNPTNFVSVRDVGEAVVHAVEDPTLRGAVIEVGGPEMLTFDEFARIIAPGQEPRHIPRPALRVMGLVATPFRPQLARLARLAVMMDTTDMTFDAAPSHAEYPWLPSTPVSTLARQAS